MLAAARWIPCPLIVYDRILTISNPSAPIFLLFLCTVDDLTPERFSRLWHPTDLFVNLFDNSFFRLAIDNELCWSSEPPSAHSIRRKKNGHDDEQLKLRCSWLKARRERVRSWMGHVDWLTWTEGFWPFLLSAIQWHTLRWFTHRKPPCVGTLFNLWSVFLQAPWK